MIFRSAAIFGQPVAHSRSPLVHGYWLKENGLSGAYLRREVSLADLPQVLKDFSQLGLAGANLTLPLKEAACAYVELDEIAAKLQAVNTLWLEDGRLCGTNTDAPGFVASMDEQVPHWRHHLENVLVLGAGGAAKAVIYGLMEAGASKVMICNRTALRAEAIAGLFGKKIKSEGWERLSMLLPKASLLVNTTSLGMAGQPALELDVKKLPANAIVADIVYAPLQTRLLQETRKAGLAVADGLGMLLHQATFGFSRWFDIKPTVTKDLRDMVAADLERAA